MKVLFVRYSLLNRGGDRMVVEYANALAAGGHEVSIFLREKDTHFKLSSQIDILKSPLPGKIGFLLYIATKSWGEDVVIADIIQLTPFIREKGKLIYFAQAYDVSFYKNKLMKLMVDKMYRRFFGNDHFCLTVSPHLTSFFNHQYGAVNCSTIQNGIDLNVFYPEPDNSLLDLKESRKSIYFMIRHDWHVKGIDVGLEALSILDRNEGVKGKFEIWFGGAPLDAAHFRAPTRHVGFVPESQLRRILSSADLFICSSRQEGFGLLPLQALACGCRVVATTAVPYANEHDIIDSVPIENPQALAASLEKLILAPNSPNMKKRCTEVAAMYGVQRSHELFWSFVAKRAKAVNESE